MNVKLYMTLTCPWCKKTKEWLRKKKIKFEQLDINEEDSWRDELLNKSGKLVVPMLDVEGQIIVGFDEKVLEKVFQKK